MLTSAAQPARQGRLGRHLSRVSQESRETMAYSEDVEGEESLFLGGSGVGLGIAATPHRRRVFQGSSADTTSPAQSPNAATAAVASRVVQVAWGGRNAGPGIGVATRVASAVTRLRRRMYVFSSLGALVHPRLAPMLSLPPPMHHLHP
jgi:hypothetical protein